MLKMKEIKDKLLFTQKKEIKRLLETSFMILTRKSANI